MSESTRLLIAEDHDLIRQGVAALLRAEPGFEVVGEAADGLSAVKLVRRLLPDVVLMDLTMPEMDGVAATREIKKCRPETRVLILTVADCERRVAEALKAGADGYTLKQTGSDQLIHAIREVRNGRRTLGEGLNHDLVQRHLEGDSDASPLAILTARERQVMKLIAEGYKNRQVAEKLGISLKTVETHRTRVMQKLNLHSGVELTALAHREGLVGDV